MTVLDMRWKCVCFSLSHRRYIYWALLRTSPKNQDGTSLSSEWSGSRLRQRLSKTFTKILVSITILLSINQYLWAQLIIHYWKCFCDRPQFLNRGNTSLNRIFAVGKQERGTIVDCMRLDSSVSISKELTIAYLWFFLTLKKGHKPETSLFFEKIWHFLIFLYRVSPYQLSLDLMKIRTEVIWRWIVGGCCRY